MGKSDLCTLLNVCSEVRGIEILQVFCSDVDGRHLGMDPEAEHWGSLALYACYTHSLKIISVSGFAHGRSFMAWNFLCGVMSAFKKLGNLEHFEFWIILASPVLKLGRGNSSEAEYVLAVWEQPSAKTTTTKLTRVFFATTNPAIHTQKEGTCKRTRCVVEFGISLAVGFGQKFEKHCLHISVPVAHGSAFGVTWELVTCTLRSHLDLQQLTFRKTLRWCVPLHA